MTKNQETTHGPRTKAELQKRVAELEAALQEQERIAADYQSIEDNYHSLFKTMLNGVAYCQVLFENGEPSDFIYLNVNDAFEKQTGLKDIIGKKVTEVIPGIKETDPKLFEIAGRVALTGQKEQFEMYVEAAKEYLQVSVYSPKKEHFVAIFDVITERKKTELALRASLEHASQLSNLLELSSQPFVQGYPDGTLGLYNQAYLDLIGYSREEIETISWDKNLTPPEWVPLELEKLENLHSTGIPVRYQKEYIRKDGSRIPIELFVHLIRNSDGSPNSYYAFITDITERRRTEKELQIAYIKYKTLFQSFPLGITVANNSGQILESNRMAEKLLGISSEKHNQRNIDSKEWQIVRTDGSLMPPEEYASVRALKEEQLIENVEMGIVKPTGEISWVSACATPIPMDEGGLVITYSDITERKHIQDDLRRSEERLHLALNAANAGTWEWDLRTNEGMWSEELLDLYRVRAQNEKPTYDILLETVHPDDRTKAEEALKDAVRRGTKLNVEWRVNDPVGKDRWIMLRGRPVYDIAGRAIRYIGISLDITDRKRAELALKESESRLHLALKTSHAGVWEENLVTGETIWSEELWELYGLKPHSCTPSYIAWLKTVHPDDLARAEEIVKSAISSGNDLSVEWRLTNQSGIERWLMSRGTAVRDEDGQIVRFIGISIDITERKLAEKALQENEHKFRVVADHTYDFESWLDPSGNYIYVSPSCERIYGYGPNAFHSDPSLRSRIIHPDDRTRFKEHVDLVERAHTHGEIEFRIVHKDGRTRWVEHACQPIFDDQGRYLGVRSSNRDISDRKLAEEALQISERNYREIFNATNEAIFLHDAATGHLLDVNDAMLRMYGYETKEEALAGNKFNLTVNEPPYTEKEALRWIRMAIEEGPQVFEWRAKKKTGELFWVEVSLRRTQIGGEGRILAVVREITDRKQAEQALRESERNYREIFNATNEAIFLHDAETGCVLDINDTALAMLGYETKKDIVGKKVGNFSASLKESPFTSEKALTRIRKAVEQGNQLFEWHARKTNGDLIWVEVSLRSTQIGGEGRVLAVARNITERKKAEEALLESEEKLRLFIEHAPVALAMFDREMRYIHASIRWISDYGLFDKEIIGESHYDLFLEMPEHWKEAHQRGLSGQIVRNDEDYYVRKDGTFQWMRWIVMPWHTASGDVGGIVIFTEDITERKHTEEENKKLQLQLTQAQKLESIGRLAGGVAHEFNNMLNVIIGYAELGLFKADPSLPQYGILTEILKAGNRSADITRKLLAFARKQIFMPKVIALNEVVEGTLKTLGKLIGENVEMVWLPDKELYPVKIDPVQIDQILTNLCLNARDAISGPGVITIHTANATLDENYCARRSGFYPGEFALLTVSDTGSGMDKETLANIFEPFFTTKEVGKGTGLGLPMVYGIVNQNRGLISVESELGKGTTVKIYLPRCYEVEAVKKTTEKTGTIPVGRGETILLVEDEHEVLITSKLILEKLGYHVLTAETIDDAISLASEHASEIHLLITDVVMPKMDGHDLAKYLHKLYPNMKILFVSGYSSNVITEKGVLEECQNFLEKPFHMEEFAFKIRQVLDKK